MVGMQRCRASPSNTCEAWDTNGLSHSSGSKVLSNARWGHVSFFRANGAICFSPWSPNTLGGFGHGIPGAGELDGVYTAGSYHVGGAHVVMFDNSVRFIPNEIDTTDPTPGVLPSAVVAAPGRQPSGTWTASSNWTSASPFGVWGAMGTAAIGESIGDTPGQ